MLPASNGANRLGSHSLALGSRSTVMVIVKSSRSALMQLFTPGSNHVYCFTSFTRKHKNSLGTLITYSLYSLSFLLFLCAFSILIAVPWGCATRPVFPLQVHGGVLRSWHLPYASNDKKKHSAAPSDRVLEVLVACPWYKRSRYTTFFWKGNGALTQICI